MTKLTFLAEEQLEAISGGNGWGGMSITSWSFRSADYKNSLRQSNIATNLVFGGGKNSFAGIINEQSNLAFQSIAA